MKQKMIRIIPLVIFLAIIGLAIYYLLSLNQETNGPLQASGTIEAVDLNLSLETGGRVTAVSVEKGASVQSGEVLARLDDTLLRAQYNQAAAALKTAQASYDLLAAGKTREQQAAASAAAALELEAARQALDALERNAAQARAQAELALASAQKSVKDAEAALANAEAKSYQAERDAALAATILAGENLAAAQEAFDALASRAEDDPLRAARLAALAQAQQESDAANRLFETLKEKTNAEDVALAKANLALAKAKQAAAEDALARLGPADAPARPDPDALALAQARLELAVAQLSLALAPAPTEEQLAVARAQVETAQASLDILAVQLARTQLLAPMDGVIMARLVEPGEIAMPGAPLLSLADLANLTITIYIPENRYGEVRLGQAAFVSVDSFPGERFAAVVVQIANQAEFTPRNVQTLEGRQTTVFAIQLSVQSPAGRLKPGMPADVVFEP